MSASRLEARSRHVRVDVKPRDFPPHPGAPDDQTVASVSGRGCRPSISLIPSAPPPPPPRLPPCRYVPTGFSRAQHRLGPDQTRVESDTTAMPCGRSSNAMSAVILSVAALAIP